MINIEKAIDWFERRKGRVSYSMENRNGPGSYDCSSAVYYALMEAGAISAGWAVNTEYEHDWLIKNGYELISENKVFEAQRGDVFIWGRKGQSAGAGGHTGVFIDGDNIIHCNYANNGVSIGDHDVAWMHSGRPYYYIYRLKEQAKAAQKTVDELAQEVVAGLHGSGDDRKNSLGSRYESVQIKVNEILQNGSKSAAPSPKEPQNATGNLAVEDIEVNVQGVKYKLQKD